MRPFPRNRISEAAFKISALAFKSGEASNNASPLDKRPPSKALATTSSNEILLAGAWIGSPEETVKSTPPFHL